MAPQRLRQQTSNCSLLLIYRPLKDERLSWPSWLTYSGWFTHISGHPVSYRLSAGQRTKARRPKTDVLPLDRATKWAPFPSKSPLPMGSSGPPSNTWLLWAIRANNPNGSSICSAVFEQMTKEHSYTLQWAALPPKNAHSHGGCRPPIEYIVP